MGLYHTFTKRAMASSRKSTIALTRAIIWPQMPYVNRKNCKFRLFGELYIVDLQSARFVRANYSMVERDKKLGAASPPPAQFVKKRKFDIFFGSKCVGKNPFYRASMLMGPPPGRCPVGRGGAKSATEPSRLRGGEVSRLPRRRRRAWADRIISYCTAVAFAA